MTQPDHPTLLDPGPGTYAPGRAELGTARKRSITW